MQKIEFYYDPSCPWCWVTSRWISEVSKSRELDVVWKPFSLAIKNKELDGDDNTGHLDTHGIGHRILRIIEAIVKDTNHERGDLYTEFTKTYFLDRSVNDEDVICEVISRIGLDSKYITEGENTTYDGAIRQSMSEAFEEVGDDVGVPIIVFVDNDGDKQGYFGPVLQGLPDTKEGLELWDGLQKLARNTRFFELKRTRRGGAKPQSTLRLFK